VVNQIDGDRLVLRAIHREEARILLAGRIPPGVVLAPGYPSRFSLEVMAMVVGAQQPGRFGPFFIIRKVDDSVVGEIGCSWDDTSATGRVGYSIVEPSWGHGYATEALRALLGHVLAEPDVPPVVAETMVDHLSSRRVMEKAGMRFRGRRAGTEDGQSVDLVVYEAVAGRTDIDPAAGADHGRCDSAHAAAQASG
jgi:RimJ/RimL family protein N-acetyltransferase